MNRNTLLLAALALLWVGVVRADDSKRVEGTWRVLAAIGGEKDKLDDAKYRGSSVVIRGKSLEWKDAAGKETFFAADFTLRQALDSKSVNEIDLTPATKEKERATFAGIYDLYTPDILKLSFHEGTTRPKGYHSGRQHQLFLLERIDLKAEKPKDPGKDAERIVGTWTMLTSLDDASDKIRPNPWSGHVCVITESRIEWKVNAKAKAFSVGADYKLDGSRTPRQIDLLKTKGGNPAPPEDGFLPAIYEFLDDDTLKICYPESGFKKDTAPKDRLRPTRFYSDGDRNLWIMKRQK
jgi:uncharacterized protein (TIGR03067 family)